MSKVYESLKEVMQEALQRNKENLVPLPRIKRSHAPKFSEELDELEATVLKKLGRLKAAVVDGQDEVEKEVQQSEELIQNLRSNAAVLESRIRQAEETTRAKELASQKTEQSLNSRIRSLEDELTKKKQGLQKREKEVEELKDECRRFNPATGGARSSPDASEGGSGNRRTARRRGGEAIQRQDSAPR